MRTFNENFVSKRVQFADMLEKLINSSPKAQVDIARELGYDNQNIITMFKKGRTRLPLDKVAPIAKLLDVDPGAMIRDWFAAYMEDALPDLEAHTGMVLSASEKSWVLGLRKAFSPVPPYDSRLTAPIVNALTALP